MGKVVEQVQAGAVAIEEEKEDSKDEDLMDVDKL
jgi:hypothetical protein